MLMKRTKRTKKKRNEQRMVVLASCPVTITASNAERVLEPVDSAEDKLCVVPCSRNVSEEHDRECKMIREP